LEPVVVKVKPSLLKQMEDEILRSRHSGRVAPRSEHEAFRLQFDSETIVGYKSGKIVSSGPKAAAAVRAALKTAASSVSSAGLTIGSDEAGKGEWLGPLVIAAVALSGAQSVELQSIGVADSKGISLAKIADLSKDIERGCRAHQAVLITPKRFNVMFEQMHEEGKSLNDLLAWGHAKALSEVHSSLKPRERDGIRVVIDEFSRMKTEIRLARVLDLQGIDLIQRPRAEDEIAVAAASILAREGRERWIDWKSSKLDTDLRELSPREADRRKDRSDIAKVSYLDTMKKK
jgi:ribonuclease HIII